MLERKLSEEQREQIEKIKSQWLKEAEEIIKLDGEKYKNKRRTRLDGEATTALAQHQIKYKNQIKEVLEDTP
jgi:hypothetical protein